MPTLGGPQGGGAAPGRRFRGNYWSVWPSLFLVSAGLMMVIPTLPLYVEEKCGVHDPDAVRVWTALIYAAGPFVAALVGPMWGALGDRVGRKAMVVRSSFAIAVCMALMPLVASPIWMLCVRAVQGLFAGYVAPAVALVAADAPPQRHGRAIGRLQVALATGTLTGPVLGAQVAASMGRDAAFWIGALFALLGAVAVAVFAREDRSRLQPFDAGALVRDVLHAPLRLLNHRVVLWLLGLLFLMRLGQNMIEPFVALWVRELGPLPALRRAGETDALAVDHTTALAFAMLAAAQLLCTPLWGRLSDRVGPLRCLAAVSLALAAVLGLSARVHDIASYLWLRAAAAVFMAGSMTLAYASLTRRAPPSEQATAFALAQSCIQFGLALGPTVGAQAAKGAGLRGLFVIAACILLVSGVGMLILRWRAPPSDGQSTWPARSP